MKNFSWVEPKNLDDASAAIKNNGALMAGGIDLLCLLKDDLAAPDRVVNLKAVKNLSGIVTANGLKIGALAQLDSIANHDVIQRDYAAIAEAAASVGSPQIRNVGTLGGNLCQRPRCWYFRDSEVHCLKKGGAKCYAVNGSSEYHAILGGGPCYIVHPSDLAPALIAFDAQVVTNTRNMPLENFFVSPEQNINAENVLQPGEIVTGVEIASGNWKSAYYKARERKSFDWALSSCAVSLRMNGNKISDVRIVLGGVAPIPYRSRGAENALRGKELSESIIEGAAKAALASASPLKDNKYKVPLTQNVIKISAMMAAGVRV